MVSDSRPLGVAPTVREPLPTCVSDLAPLPPDFAATLNPLLPALGCGQLSPGQIQAVENHVRLLLAWNDAINLTAVRSASGIALEHVADSLAAVPLLRRLEADELLDLGSGAGYPGLPLAIALPVRRALLVESIGKKARFLETAVSCAGEAWPALLDTTGVGVLRAENLARDAGHRERWQCLVARAVAALPELAEIALPLVRRGGFLVAWKRRPIDEELDAARVAVRALGGELESIEDVAVPGLTDHVLVVVRKVAATAIQYPREPAARRNRPLAARSGSRPGSRQAG